MLWNVAWSSVMVSAFAVFLLVILGRCDSIQIGFAIALTMIAGGIDSNALDAGYSCSAGLRGVTCWSFSHTWTCCSLSSTECFQKLLQLTSSFIRLQIVSLEDLTVGVTAFLYQISWLSDMRIGTSAMTRWVSSYLHLSGFVLSIISTARKRNSKCNSNAFSSMFSCKPGENSSSYWVASFIDLCFTVSILYWFISVIWFSLTVQSLVQSLSNFCLFLASDNDERSNPYHFWFWTQIIHSNSCLFRASYEHR
jgi:hypothetical protein